MKSFKERINDGDLVDVSAIAAWFGRDVITVRVWKTRGVLRPADIKVGRAYWTRDVLTELETKLAEKQKQMEEDNKARYSALVAKSTATRQANRAKRMQEAAAV